MPERPLVFIPTYNERENVEPTASQILALGLDLDLLFLDDNSPDGTGEVLDRLAAQHPNVSVIHRKAKSGIGSAHLEGIRWAYDRGYKLLITMDCDQTHPPKYIPDFIRVGQGCQFVVGSRHLRSDALKDWDVFRLVLTKLAHFVTQNLLQLPYDATGAYRLYHLDDVPRQLFDLVQSQSYSFFFESLYILNLNGFAIREVAIDLPARTRGHSKMSVRDALRSIAYLFYLRLICWLDRERLTVSEPFALAGGAPERSSEEWDRYWNKRSGASGLLFDLGAAFYRKFIIRRALTGFVSELFAPGAELLHAGCGGGQVDVEVTKRMKVTALDISLPALRMYHRSNVGRGKLVHGDIFAIPLPDASVDGVYNLGVMEHFAEDELVRILKEFRRILRPKGKVLLFWPPVFGLSVMALDSAHFLLNRVLGKNVKLHPDEVTRVRSREQMSALLGKAGLKLSRFYFGPRDLFTHAVLVAEPV